MVKRCRMASAGRCAGYMTGAGVSPSTQTINQTTGCPMKRSLFSLLVLPLLLVACGDDDTTGPDDDATPFTTFPTVVAPTAIVNRSDLKVFVPDGSGGWSDASSEVSSIDCDALAEGADDDLLNGDQVFWFRFLSESSVGLVGPDAPTDVLLGGRYTRSGGDYMIKLESPFGADSIEYAGRAENDRFYASYITICTIESGQGGSATSSVRTGFSGSSKEDVMAAFPFEGDTVAYRTFELEYEKK